jgi:membrane-bound ClpP family serine protease
VFADPLPPLLLMAAGIVLWLSTAVALGGGPVQVNGIALFTIGAAWLVAERCDAYREKLAVVEEPRQTRMG